MIRVKYMFTLAEDREKKRKNMVFKSYGSLFPSQVAYVNHDVRLKKIIYR